LYQIVESLGFKKTDCPFAVFPPEKFPHILDCDILMTSQFLVTAKSVNVVKTVLPERFGDDLFDGFAKLNLPFGKV
jgi:hypothetical protein